MKISRGGKSFRPLTIVLEDAQELDVIVRSLYFYSETKVYLANLANSLAHKIGEWVE